MTIDNLTPTESRIYDHLQKWCGQVIPYHELWSIGANLDSLYVMMKNIRSKTGAQIMSIRGKGYMLDRVIEVKSVNAAPRTRKKCRTCGARLYHYDVERGECWKHAVERIRAGRDGR